MEFYLRAAVRERLHKVIVAVQAGASPSHQHLVNLLMITGGGLPIIPTSFHVMSVKYVSGFVGSSYLIFGLHLHIC